MKTQNVYLLTGFVFLMMVSFPKIGMAGCGSVKIQGIDPDGLANEDLPKVDFVSDGPLPKGARGPTYARGIAGVQFVPGSSFKKESEGTYTVNFTFNWGDSLMVDEDATKKSNPDKGFVGQSFFVPKSKSTIQTVGIYDSALKVNLLMYAKIFDRDVCDRDPNAKASVVVDVVYSDPYGKATPVCTVEGSYNMFGKCYGE